MVTRSTARETQSSQGKEYRFLSMRQRTGAPRALRKPCRSHTFFFVAFRI